MGRGLLVADRGDGVKSADPSWGGKTGQIPAEQAGSEGYSEGEEWG